MSKAKNKVASHDHVPAWYLVVYIVVDSPAPNIQFQPTPLKKKRRRSEENEENEMKN